MERLQAYTIQWCRGGGGNCPPPPPLTFRTCLHLKSFLYLVCQPQMLSSPIKIFASDCKAVSKHESGKKKFWGECPQTPLNHNQKCCPPLFMTFLHRCYMLLQLCGITCSNASTIHGAMFGEATDNTSFQYSNTFIC